VSDVATRCVPGSRGKGSRVAWLVPCVVAIANLAMIDLSAAETLQEALVKAYQTNPQLNSERARQRGTDENVPQALAGYRPQIVASLGAGLQAVRNLLPDNTVQSATLRPWTIGVTVSQVLFNGNKTANSVRVAEFQVKSGREALRNVGQGVLLDAVTAYMNVLANQALVEAQRTNVAVLREIQATTKRRLDAGDVTPTDTAQADSRLSRGLADLNAAEVVLAISKATYAQVIGQAPSQLVAASTVDGLSPNALATATQTAEHENPAVLGAGFDVDVAQTTISVAESSLLPTVSVQASASRAVQSDPTLTTAATDQASVLGQLNVPIYDGGTAASQTRQAKELVSQSRLVLEQIRNQTRTAVASAWVSNEGTKIALTAAESEMRAAGIALQGVRREAAGGQRTTIDVLNAQQDLTNARTRLIQSQRDRVIASYTLLSAVGRLDVHVLNLNTPDYLPEVHYHQVRDAWHGVRTPSGQ
jgi:outer membrane protein